MRYEYIYNQITERAKNRVLVGYNEKHHIIPKCLGGDNSKENLVKKIYQNVSLFENELKYKSPGIQTNILLKCKEIDYILNYGAEKCKELFYKDSNIEDVTYAIYPWSFISRNETTASHFHNHDMFAPNVKKSIKSNYTFIYYVQIPNNLKDNDGKLFIVDEEQ